MQIVQIISYTGEVVWKYIFMEFIQVSIIMSVSCSIILLSKQWYNFTETIYK